MRIERFPIAGSFTISRGSKTEAVVVIAEVRDGAISGRGECVPYPRYGETPEAVAGALTEMAEEVAQGLDRDGLQRRLPAGAARNALDCAFWDFEAKASGIPAFRSAGLATLRPLDTAYTLSLDTPDAMAAAARRCGRPLLKLKLGAPGDALRLAAVRAAAPAARLIVDANEGWEPETVAAHFAACREAGVELIEQPLPAGADAVLEQIARPVPVCADESVHDRASLAGLVGKYDAVNVKLDKTGGLTEALLMAQAARTMGFDLMVGCMLATSLAMAPAMLVAQMAQVVDLDGPLLLTRDRDHGLRYDGARVSPPEPALWG
ncbi:L-alanine-DL-glutamate epimerase-like enolase superfamily enzyme [Aquabacter spiritensis]|uniref:Dipeptide epimerase n=1 Tax=Aquabacter spiritensis TaxID=933073 RepID=A0A4R3LR36_9HYPH|nr:L-alanine-DL-glutamate epimerase-like enolase superfamily enzyme [Aquabacter spiritensis]